MKRITEVITLILLLYISAVKSINDYFINDLILVFS